MPSNTQAPCMAGASDPLEDMLFSEVDEKAVSDLVGSLESQLTGQSNSAGKTDENGGASSVAPANHHLGKTLPAPVSTTTPEQQQQHPGRRNKAEMRQEVNSKDASVDKTVTSPSLASITSLTASGASTSASPQDSISRSSKVSPGTDETSALRKRVATPRRTPSARIKSLNGAAVTTRRSSGSLTDSITGATRSTTSSINTSTFTLSNANLPVGQSAIALDRGTPTIALRRLPSHIVASIAQNGTSVSALVQQGARMEAASSSPPTEDLSKATDTGASKAEERQPGFAGGVSSVINTVSPPASCAITPATSTASSAPSTTVSQPVSSAAAAAAVCVTATCVHTTSVTTTVCMVRPAAPSPTPTVAPSAQSQPRPGVVTPQRIVAPQLIVRPSQQQTTIHSDLAPALTVLCRPAGMVLVRTELGQLVMVPQQALAQAQAQAQAQNNISPRPAAPTTGTSFRVTTPQVRLASRQSPATSQTPRPCPLTSAKVAPSPSTTLSILIFENIEIFIHYILQEMQENVKKCKNFLATLIKLASHNSPSPETSKNVKALVQDLLDAKIEPEEFTSRLQTELKSSPQPYLVPFLKKSLPALRLSLLNSQQSLTQPLQQGVKPAAGGAPPAMVAGPAVRIRHPNSVSTTVGVGALPTGTVGHAAAMVCTEQSCGAIIQAGKCPMVPPVQIAGNQKNKLNDPGGGSFRDDDDINDVASMAGVNLNEESARILATNSELVGTQIRSCKDEAFLHPGLLHRRILETAKKFGVTEVPMEAVTFISHATQSRLRTVVEKVSIIAQHRLDSCKDDECYEQSADVRSQLRFFEQLERMEKQRKDEQEREILLKAAKSRSRQEDPEQARLKQKAKEMQQQELAQMRQRDANLTALAAIGPRKKRKLDSPGATPSGTEVSGSTAGSPACSSAPSTSSRQYTRQRITRVNLRDLIFYMEQERETAHSLLLYRALLK
uniref:Transcription initiation factor TFIID subunit 4-like n=1 Tax=Cyprinodon variegatus TaxID=28743 RepID=A0A3Q2E6F2_CYPVA